MQGSTTRFEHLYTVLAKSRQTRFFRDMTPTLAGWFFAWLIPAITGLLVAQSLLQFMFYLLVGYIGARRYKWGPGIYYPRDWWRGWQIKCMGGEIFIGENDPQPVEVQNVKPLRRRLVKSPRAFRSRAQAISLVPTNFLDVLASIYDPDSGVDTVYVRLSGWVHANDTVFDRHEADLQVLSVLKTVIAQLPGDIGLCPVTCPRPYDPAELTDDLLGHFVSDEVLQATPDGDPVAYRLQRHINEQLLNAARKGREYYGLYALSVRRPPSWQAFAKSPADFTKRDLLDSPHMRVLDALVEGLVAQGFRGVHIFTMEDLEEFIFRTWNVSYVERMLAGDGNARRKPGESAWPSQHIIVNGRSNVIEIDGTYHRVLVTTQYGINRIIAGGFYDLMTGNKRWVSMAVPYVTGSRGLEAFLLKQTRDLVVAYQNERYKGGMIEDRESRDRRKAQVDRVDALYLSGSKPTRSNRYFVVSGITMEQLDEAQRLLEVKLRRKQMRVEPVRGRARILRAFLAASLGLSL